LNNLAATEWIRGWKRSNWIKKTDSKPVMNKDLMIKIDELQQKLKLKWVLYLDIRTWSFIK
jgi:ribonuclease HI